MRTILTSLLAVPALAGPAMAHAGDHGGFSVEHLVAHAVGAPDLAAALALSAVVLVAVAVRLHRTRRS